MTTHLPIYLDYMATTPVDPRVAEKMQACLTLDGNFGNPGSVSHYYGWQALKAVELARQHVAELINADAEEIIFTSGATESNNLAIKGAAQFYQRKGKHIITTKTAHKAILDPLQYLQGQGFEVTYLDVAENGLLDMNHLADAIRDDTIVVSVLHVNNEIGVIQDIAAISKLVRPKGILLHVDAAQSAGKIPVDVKSVEVDLLSMSAHKLYGPKGIGSLYVRRKPRVRLQPLLHGGSQEQGLRSGTLATHQIVGMGYACDIARQELSEESRRILKLRERFLAGIKQLPEIYINGDLQQRVPGNLNVSFNYVEGEALLMALKDIAVSSGSACTSATIEPSYVLRALGVCDELAHSSVRFSFGRFTTTDDVDTAINHVVEQVNRLRAMSPLWNESPHAV